MRLMCEWMAKVLAGATNGWCLPRNPRQDKAGEAQHGQEFPEILTTLTIWPLRQDVVNW